MLDEQVGVPAALTSHAPVVTGAIWATDAPSRVCSLGLQRAAAVWVSSAAQLGALDSIGVRRVAHVPMGVDEVFFKRTESERTGSILTVGNDRHRDHDTLVRAMAALGDENAELTVISRLQPPSHPRVNHIPHVPHTRLRDHYRKAEIVAVAVRPNLHVSGITATLEAMASGRPVVVSDTPGMRDYVDDGVTGLLVPPGDATAMSAAVQSLLRNPQRATEMAEASRRQLEEKFTSRHQALGVAELIKSLA